MSNATASIGRPNRAFPTGERRRKGGEKRRRKGDILLIHRIK
jgi:hypothetical protein